MAQNIPQEVQDLHPSQANQPRYYGPPPQYGQHPGYPPYPPQQYPPQQYPPHGYPPQQFQGGPYYPPNAQQPQQQPYVYGQPYRDNVSIGVNEPSRDERAIGGGGGGGGWLSQNMDDDYWNIEEDKKLQSDIDISIRMAFIRKVYGILSGQLLVTFGLALWFNLHEAAAIWLYQNIWVMIIGVVLMCASVCTLTCVPKAGRKVPLNYILLFVLALSMGVILGYSTGAVDTPAFAMAAGMTAAVTIAVSLFACQTKWDFTGCGVYGFVALILLMIFGLVCAFVRNRITHIVYASLGAALFSFYIIMDTQKIVGGKHRKYQFSIDDYAFAALALYLDIINLFLYILQILALTDQG